MNSSGGEGIHRVQSSPGYLHVGQVPSNCTLHIPQTSSSGMSQRQEATAFHSSMVTFMLIYDRGVAVVRGAEDQWLIQALVHASLGSSVLGFRASA